VAETHWRRKLNSPWRAQLLARRVDSEKSIKSLSLSDQRDHTILRYATLGREKNKGNHRENLRSKEHKD